MELPAQSESMEIVAKPSLAFSLATVLLVVIIACNNSSAAFPENSARWTGLAFSADGKSLIASRNDSTAQGTYSISISTGEVTRPAWASHGVDHIPVFSPDGKHLAYSHSTGKEPHSQIWLANADGSNAHQLLFSNSHDLFPMFSATPNRIYFARAGFYGNYDGLTATRPARMGHLLLRPGRQESAPTYSREFLRHIGTSHFGRRQEPHTHCQQLRRREATSISDLLSREAVNTCTRASTASAAHDAPSGIRISRFSARRSTPVVYGLQPRRSRRLPHENRRRYARKTHDCERLFRTSLCFPRRQAGSVFEMDRILQSPTRRQRNSSP